MNTLLKMAVIDTKEVINRSLNTMIDNKDVVTMMIETISITLQSKIIWEFKFEL